MTTVGTKGRRDGGHAFDACPDESVWMSYWDDELTPLMTEAAERHLAQCEACRGRLRAMAAGVAALGSVDESGRPAAAPSAAQDRRRKVPRAAYGLGAAAVLAAVAVLAPFGRAALATVTQTYTVSHLAAIAVTRQDMVTAMKDLTKNGQVSLATYGSVSEAGLRKAPVAVPLHSLTTETGLPNLWPSGLPSPSTALVGTGGSITFELHVRALNALILDEGGTHLFPSALSGERVTVKVPPRAVMMGESGSGAAGVVVAETQVPTVVLPGGASERQVWTAVASLPFLPSSVQKALAAIPNPGSTAVVPVTGAGQAVTFQGRRAVLEKTSHGWGLVFLHGTTLVILGKSGSSGMSAAQFVSWATAIYQ
jgi:anti-sigma factor RsiW